MRAATGQVAWAEAPVAVSRWSRTASWFAVLAAVVVLVLVAVPYVWGGPAEQPLITLLTFVAMASLWNLLAGFSGLTSFGQHAYLGVGAYALYLVAAHGVNPLAGIVCAGVAACVVSLPVSVLVLRLSGGYFAVATLVIAAVFQIAVTLSPSVGGTTGVSVPGLAVYGPVLREALIYWATLAVAVVCVAGVYLLVRRVFGLDARAAGSDPVAAASAGVRVRRIRRLAYLMAAGGAGAVGAVIALQTLYVEPTSVFNIQYSVYMLFMVLIGGIGTIEGPVLGALVLFALQESLSAYGAWYLVVVGAAAVIATLVFSRGLWGLASDRFGWSLLPVGYQVSKVRPLASKLWKLAGGAACRGSPCCACRVPGWSRGSWCARCSRGEFRCSAAIRCTGCGGSPRPAPMRPPPWWLWRGSPGPESMSGLPRLSAGRFSSRWSGWHGTVRVSPRSPWWLAPPRR
ncbi:MAG: branched-chain amino acid ABC transporter permease [Streptosporangiaceae bacterium]|nr:branched-chain amino acid ABC transporter permease [Streptosporangiaceae bacterium]